MPGSSFPHEAKLRTLIAMTTDETAPRRTEERRPECRSGLPWTRLYLDAEWSVISRFRSLQFACLPATGRDRSAEATKRGSTAQEYAPNVNEDHDRHQSGARDRRLTPIRPTRISYRHGSEDRFPRFARTDHELVVVDIHARGVGIRLIRS